MICKIHKILVMIKNHLNYLKHNIFECFFNPFCNFLSLMIYIIFVMIILWFHSPF